MTVSERELNRQFRVLDQTLSMHAILRDRYSKLALFLDIIFLTCAVIFCATTFAHNDLFIKIGLSPQHMRYILGVASIMAFLASLLALRVGWKGKAVQHRDAVNKLSNILSLFRELRRHDGSWPKEHAEELHRAYWDGMNNIVEVPESRFINLKARSLRKKEISKMLDSTPGCPVFILRIKLLLKSMLNILGK